jgi:hypothetical protein
VHPVLLRLLRPHESFSLVNRRRKGGGEKVGHYESASLGDVGSVFGMRVDELELKRLG